MAGWIAGSTLLAAGAWLIGYTLGLRAGTQRSSLAKDLRISAQEQRIARLEKALTVEPSVLQHKAEAEAGKQSNGATDAQRR